MIWWIFFGTCAVFYYFVIFKPFQTWKRRNVAHIKPWPIVGNFGPAVLQRTSFAENVQDLYNYFNASYFGIYQFMVPTLVIKDVDLIKQICVKEFDSFMDHRLFTTEDIDPLFGKNLFTLTGQKWRNMRAVLSPAFTGSKMRSMFNLMSECAAQSTDYLTKTFDPKKPNTVEMKDIFTRIANDIIASCAFGLKCDSLQDTNNEFYLMGKDASTFSGIRTLKFFGYSISPFLMNLFQIKLFEEKIGNFFRNIVHSTIKTREEKGIYRPDMIHLLMEARKGKLKHEKVSNSIGEDEAGFATVQESNIGKEIVKQELSDDDITAQAMLFFIAGFDSIATMMCHMANELALNPDIQEKLQVEIDNTLDECNNKITYEAVTKMKYLDMVISETLRKWPGGPFLDRLCTKSVTLKTSDSKEEPLVIEKGDAIMIPVFPLHRNPKFFPNPEKFDPERFSDENKSNIEPLAFLSFGAGPRNCIGSRFALLEAKTIFVFLLSRFELAVDKKTDIPFKLSRTNFNITAANGFWLGLKLRNK